MTNFFVFLTIANTFAASQPILGPAPNIYFLIGCIGGRRHSPLARSKPYLFATQEEQLGALPAELSGLHSESANKVNCRSKNAGLPPLNGAKLTWETPMTLL